MMKNDLNMLSQLFCIMKKLIIIQKALKLLPINIIKKRNLVQNQKTEKN